MKILKMTKFVKNPGTQPGGSPTISETKESASHHCFCAAARRRHHKYTPETPGRHQKSQNDQFLKKVKISIFKVVQPKSSTIYEFDSRDTKLMIFSTMLLDNVSQTMSYDSQQSVKI